MCLRMSLFAQFVMELYVSMCVLAVRVMYIGNVYCICSIEDFYTSFFSTVARFLKFHFMILMETIHAEIPLSDIIRFINISSQYVGKYKRSISVLTHVKLYAGADEIIRNECCKFLGIIIDDKLGWLDHINSINSTLSRSLYILNSVKNMLPNYILRQLYFTMVQPYLTYGIILWGSTYQSYLKRTVILQKKAIRYMHKAHYNAHTKPLFYDSMQAMC